MYNNGNHRTTQLVHSFLCLFSYFQHCNVGDDLPKHGQHEYVLFRQLFVQCHKHYPHLCNQSGIYSLLDLGLKSNV